MLIANICYSFSDACSKVKCHSDSECVVESNGKASCKCKDATKCPTTTKEVCGTDGKTYKNKCFLKATSCKGPKRIRVARDGPCGTYEFSFMYLWIF